MQEKRIETKKTYYNLGVEAVLNETESRRMGLNPEEVANRLTKFGKNTLPEKAEDSLFWIFIRQFKSPLIYILLLAGVIVGLLGETTDTLTILAVLLINAVFGSFQEGRAQNTLKALKDLIKTEATVLRNGKEISILDAELVPGDILVLREGDKVAADARLIEGNLEANESALTGESLPVTKNSETLENHPAIFEQKNMLFKGTDIVHGSGLAVVVFTGTNTQIGGITKEISGEQTEIPLQKQIDKFSMQVIWAVVIFSVLLFVFGILRGLSVSEMFRTVVSLAVSVIPEGLPVVITLVLATGVYRMSKRNALVRKLQAIESLGEATVIATDKTGTLTRNELQVEKIFTGGKLYKIEGEGYSPTASILSSGEVVLPIFHPELQNSALIAALCTKASVVFEEKSKRYRVLGDPTEGALIVFAERLGLSREALLHHNELLAEIPFDYKKRLRVVVYKFTLHNTLYTVGAPEAVTALCDLDEREKAEINEIVEKFSAEGLRVLAGAFRENIKELIDSEIPKLEFACIFGLSDSLHAEVQETIRELRTAGIKVAMITGDNKITAAAIAEKAGLDVVNDKIVTGSELENLEGIELERKVNNATVFARVTPEHKLKIIEAYRRHGEVVAMTGDGVNDAPALVKADLGVAMGITGTSVAKEAADIILLDDKLTSIASAVEEGRNIYQTIKKVLLYLFSTNIGEALTITAALVFALPLPILPTHIIWLNFVTDGFLTVALGLEKKESNLLEQQAEKKPNIFDKSMWVQIFILSTVMAIGSIMVFVYYRDDLTHGYSMTLTIMAVFQWFNAWNCRDRKKSIFSMNPFGNPWLIIASLIVLLLQLFALYTPVMNRLLKTTPLSWNEWVAIIVIASSIIWVEEIRKVIAKNYQA